MDPQKRKLLILAGVGVAVLYLFSRTKNGSPTQKAAANDPVQTVAQQLAAQKAGEQASLDYAKAQVQNSIDLTNLQFGEFKKLAADPAYACPNGGRPRWIPGQGPGCIEKRSGALTFGSIISDVVGGYKTYLGFKSQSQGGRGQSGGGGGNANGSYPDTRY